MKRCVKSEQLGMSHSTANNRLKRNIMFDLICKSNKNVCFRCGKQMTAEDWSIEHKEDWLHNSIELFWSLDNIAFSHKSCNYAAAKRPNKKDIPDGKMYCSACEEILSEGRFAPSQRKWNAGRCNRCRGKVINKNRKDKRRMAKLAK